jgi:hypothetical protein
LLDSWRRINMPHVIKAIRKNFSSNMLYFHFC